MPSQDFVFVGINVRTWVQLSPLNHVVDGRRMIACRILATSHCMMLLTL